MKVFVALAIACFVWTGTALACEVEEWNHSYDAFGITIFGAATCERGKIGIRLYDGEGENRKIIGVSETYIGSYVFETWIALPEPPKAVSVKFSINSEF